MPINNYEINSALSTQEQKSGGKFWLVILLLIILAGLYYMYDNKKVEAPAVNEQAMNAPAEKTDAGNSETMNALSAEVESTFKSDSSEDINAIEAEFKN